MGLSNTQDRYGSVTKTFHWLTVLLILTIIPLGILAHDAPFGTAQELARKAMLFSLHKTLGVSIFCVAVARIAWALSQPRPGLLNPDKKIEAFLAEAVHWLLYGSLVLVPLSGWLHHASTSGFAPIWWPFGQNLPFIPKNETLADLTSGLHIVFERVLVVSIVLHVAGALKHRLIDRDQTLQRMLPGSNSAPRPAPSPHSVLPAFGALAAWVVAITIGVGLGVFNHDKAAVASIDLQQVNTGWQVESGTLEISVSQFGSDVTGQFADWMAAIEFDDQEGISQPGKVEVVIAIGSLSLGSVTDQAMGFDFFNAEAFPTAVFTADIIRTETAYEARGTLTIKGKATPITLPFDLAIQEDTATMQARLTLDRRDFNIADTMPDEGSLGFSVVLTVALSAVRNTD